MSEPVPPIAFDDVVLDLAGRRLLRGGTDQPLEPKAFAVLALLAGSPGQVFTRDEILDAVWSHRHVTPGVLNRVMTLLRHALGEDAQSARYLHTVHGVGYRFNLPAAPGETLAVADDARLREPSAGTDFLPRNDGGSAPPAPALRRATDLSKPRRLGRAMLWILPLLGLVAFAGWRSWPASAPTMRSQAPISASTPSTLLVIPLKPMGGGGGIRTIADGLSEELICSLARIDGLRVIAHESTRMLGNDNVPTGQAQGLGITHALEGSLQQSGQHLRVRLRMVKPSTGELLWTRDFDRDATEALSLQRDIAEAVATSLSLELGLSIPTASGGDAEFQRRFLGARILTMGTGLPREESLEKAEAEFRALLRERPDDARTHAWLALALRLRAYRQPELGPALRQESVREATLATRLDPSRYEPYLVLAADDCRHDRWQPCMARLERALALAPGLVYVHIDLSTALARLGYLDRAEAHARESLVRDPLNPGAHEWMARLLDTRGKHREAAAQFRLAGPGAIHGRWFNAVWRKDTAAALRLASSLDATGAAASSTRLKPSLVAVSRALATPALWPRALAELQRFERENPGRMNFAQVFIPDAAAQANALATQLIAAQPGNHASFDLLLWTADLAFLRRTPAFQQHLRDAGILAYWRKHGFPQQCRPQGDGAYCD